MCFFFLFLVSSPFSTNIVGTFLFLESESRERPFQSRRNQSRFGDGRGVSWFLTQWKKPTASDSGLTKDWSLFSCRSNDWNRKLKSRLQKHLTSRLTVGLNSASLFIVLSTPVKMSFWTLEDLWSPEFLLHGRGLKVNPSAIWIDLSLTHPGPNQNRTNRTLRSIKMTLTLTVFYPKEFQSHYER